MTLAGLNTVDLSDLNVFQQFILFILLLLGSSIFVSITIVHVRRHAFEKLFLKIKHEEGSHVSSDATKTSIEATGAQSLRVPTSSYQSSVPSEMRIPVMQGNQPACSSNLVMVPQVIATDLTAKPWNASSTRQSESFGKRRRSLSRKDNFCIGGPEYRAIYFLGWLVPAYFLIIQVSGCIGLGWYMAVYSRDITESNGLNPWWVGAFNAVSAFNNSGMSLLDANMIPFQTAYYVLITMGILILAGNTCYPIFLRFSIWCIMKLLPNTPRFSGTKETLSYLLQRPRRCYTNLFPAHHTWWLLGTVIVLNSIDWVAFEVLNLGKHIIDSLPLAARIIDGLFQAIAIRSGGFYVVPIAETRISLQMLYVIMMYISVYPVVFTMRQSNVYEERSLGIYSAQEEADDMTFKSHTQLPRRKFFKHQLRVNFASDIWWLVAGIWVIVITEATQIERDPANFSVFNIIFESVSGYGCVGVSTGFPDVNYSFCGKWTKLSKLVLCLIMLRGRHRGLPVAIDKALELPGRTGISEHINMDNEHQI